MRSVLVVSVPGSGTTFTLNMLARVARRSSLRLLMRGHGETLGHLHFGDSGPNEWQRVESFYETPAVIPIRPPALTLHSRVRRGYGHERVVEAWRAFMRHAFEFGDRIFLPWEEMDEELLVRRLSLFVGAELEPSEDRNTWRGPERGSADRGLVEFAYPAYYKALKEANR